MGCWRVLLKCSANSVGRYSLPLHHSILSITMGRIVLHWCQSTIFEAITLHSPCVALQRMTCYFDSCGCHHNCNCDVVWDDAKLVPCASMGNVGNAALVEYKLNLPLVQRPLPQQKLIGHFNYTACGYPRFTLVSGTDCIRHLPGSGSRFPH